MRKLLNTLYVTSPDAYLSLDGENIVILKGDDVAARIPLHNLESVVTFGYTGASPALMGACAKRNISLSFMTASGRFLARIIGEDRGNIVLRKKQYNLSECDEESLKIAKNFIIGKLFNSRWVIERFTRDYEFRLDCEKLKAISKRLSTAILTAQDTT
ncbi:MAG: CRISPR-associated endonuclease Cas1, partial [Oscillospiraceae bacterium]